MIQFVMRAAEVETTLADDLALLDSVVDWKLRAAIIYRSERKSILHSQLHLVEWLDYVLSVCDKSPSLEELPSFFK